MQFFDAPSRRQWRVRQWRVDEEESIPLATWQQIPSICVVEDVRGRDTRAAKGGGVSTRWGGYGPGVAEGGLGRDAFGPRGGKGYLAGRAGGCPRSAEGARFRLNIGETSVTSRRSFREDFARIAYSPSYLGRTSDFINWFSLGVNSLSVDWKRLILRSFSVLRSWKRDHKVIIYLSDNFTPFVLTNTDMRKGLHWMCVWFSSASLD